MQSSTATRANTRLKSEPPAHTMPGSFVAVVADVVVVVDDVAVVVVGRGGANAGAVTGVLLASHATGPSTALTPLSTLTPSLTAIVSANGGVPQAAGSELGSVKIVYAIADAEPSYTALLFCAMNAVRCECAL